MNELCIDVSNIIINQLYPENIYSLSVVNKRWNSLCKNKKKKLTDNDKIYFTPISRILIENYFREKYIDTITETEYKPFVIVEPCYCNRNHKDVLTTTDFNCGLVFEARTEKEALFMLYKFRGFHIDVWKECCYDTEEEFPTTKNLFSDYILSEDINAYEITEKSKDTIVKTEKCSYSTGSCISLRHCYTIVL